MCEISAAAGTVLLPLSLTAHGRSDLCGGPEGSDARDEVGHHDAAHRRARLFPSGRVVPKLRL